MSTPSEAGQIQASVLNTLIAVAKALAQNPKWFPMVLAVYVNGLFINYYLFRTTYPFFVFPELASGAIWVAFFSTMLADVAGGEVPTKGDKGLRFAWMCLILSTAGLGVMLASIMIFPGIEMIVDEVKRGTGRDIRLYAKLGVALGTIVAEVHYFVGAVRIARRQMVTPASRVVRR